MDTRPFELLRRPYVRKIRIQSMVWQMRTAILAFTFFKEGIEKHRV